VRIAVIFRIVGLAGVLSQFDTPGQKVIGTPHATALTPLCLLFERLFQLLKNLKVKRRQ
jgi:hypothetical protein